jgi:hypothetical protein
MITTYYVPVTLLNVYLYYSVTSTHDRKAFIGWHRFPKDKCKKNIKYKTEIQVTNTYLLYLDISLVTLCFQLY